LSTIEILDLLEDYPPNNPTDIVIFLPLETNDLSDEDDEVEEIGGVVDVNSVAKKIL
ncbi:Hypothetical protein FKW44_002311, partial [Caligus rogercresseyi]